MRKTALLLAGTMIAAVAAAAHGLDAVNGSTVTSLFRTSDVSAGVQYPAGFAGVRWDDTSITRFELGVKPATPLQFLAANADGDLFFVVHGATGTSVRYKGLIHWDGTNFVHLAQDTLDIDLSTGIWSGSSVKSVTVSPVTAGRLDAGDPVIVRAVAPAGGGTSAQAAAELWSVDPSTSPASETLVHRLTLSNANAGSPHIDSAGAIYVPANDGTILKLTYNGSGYDESALAPPASALTLSTDGALYGFDPSTHWGKQSGKGWTNDILKIDTVTGASSVHASVQGKDFAGVSGTAFDATGRFWVGLYDGTNDIVMEVTAGQTISGRNVAPIASTGGALMRTMTGIPGSELYIAEYTSHLPDAETEVFRVEPGSSGGGGSGGGGNGNGNGKGKGKK